MPATDRRVRETFIELTDTLVRDFDVVDFLDRLAARCTELLEVSACGILLVDQRGALSLVGGFTGQARLLGLSQLENAEGPCLDAYRTGAPVQRTTLADGDPRWPRFAAVNLFQATAVPLAPDTIALGYTSPSASPSRWKTPSP